MCPYFLWRVPFLLPLPLLSSQHYTYNVVLCECVGGGAVSLLCVLAVGGASSAASGSGGGENNGECEWVTSDCSLWRDGEWEDHPTTTVPL